MGVSVEVGGIFVGKGVEVGRGVVVGGTCVGGSVALGKGVWVSVGDGSAVVIEVAGSVCVGAKRAVMVISGVGYEKGVGAEAPGRLHARTLPIKANPTKR